MTAFMNLKANDETLLITSCVEELEEYLDKYEEICRRHGYELTLNGQTIHKLEHPLFPPESDFDMENDLSGDGQCQWDNAWSLLDFHLQKV